MNSFIHKKGKWIKNNPKKHISYLKKKYKKKSNSSYGITKYDFKANVQKLKDKYGTFDVKCSKCGKEISNKTSVFNQDEKRFYCDDCV